MTKIPFSSESDNSLDSLIKDKMLVKERKSFSIVQNIIFYIRIYFLRLHFAD